jgi:putative lipoic acid-binding regulatory protein
MTPALSRDLLESTHDFPCEYLWKIFALHRDSLEAEAFAAAFRVLRHDTIRTRTSRASSGRNLCVTIEAHVEDAQQVIDVYAELRRIDGLRMMM